MVTTWRKLNQSFLGLTAVAASGKMNGNVLHFPTAYYALSALGVVEL